MWLRWGWLLKWMMVLSRFERQLFKVSNKSYNNFDYRVYVSMKSPVYFMTEIDSFTCESLRYRRYPKTPISCNPDDFFRKSILVKKLAVIMIHDFKTSQLWKIREMVGEVNFETIPKSSRTFKAISFCASSLPANQSSTTTSASSVVSP